MQERLHNFERLVQVHRASAARSGSASRIRPTTIGTRPQTAGAARPWSATHDDLQLIEALSRPAAALAARGLGAAAKRQRCHSARLAQRHRRAAAAAPRALSRPARADAHATPTPPHQQPPPHRRVRQQTAQTIPYGDVRHTSPAHVTAATLYDSTRVVDDPSKFDSWTLAVHDWEESFAAEQGNYPSMLLYCQMKLKEAFSAKGGEAEHGPDPFRVAVVCKLHAKLVRLFGRYEGLMSVLHDEMMRAIYPDPQPEQQPQQPQRQEKGGEEEEEGAGQEQGPNEPKQRASGWQRAQHMIERPPFFVQAKRTTRKNEQLRAQIEIYTHKEDFIKREKTQREFAIRFTVNTWRWKCVTHMWDKWKLVTELGRTVLNNTRSRMAQRRMMRRFHAWRQWQLCRHVLRYKDFVDIIKPDHKVRDFPLEGDEVELDQFGKPKQPPTITEKIAWFRKQDRGYQELLGEIKDIKKQLRKYRSDTMDFAQELFCTKPLVDQHLKEDEREKVFTRWSMLSSKALIGTEDKLLGKQVRDIRASSNNAAEEARARAENLGLLAAKMYGKRMVRTFRNAEEAKRDGAAMSIQRISRGWRERARYKVEISDFRKMMATANTSGLVGPRSSQQQDLLFKLDYLAKELARLQANAHACPDTFCLGDIRTQDPVDILFAWVNHHLESAGSARRLRQWTADLHDSEIFAVLIDELNKSEVIGAVTQPLSLLLSNDAGDTAAPPPPSPIGLPSLLSRVKAKEGMADRAVLVAKQLAQWKDQNGVPGTVVLNAPHVASPDGLIGDESKLQFALARMFTLRAALPPTSSSLQWSRRHEHLQLGLTNVSSQMAGIRAQRRGWCSVRQLQKDNSSLLVVLHST